MTVRSLFLEMLYFLDSHIISWGKAVAACAKKLKGLQNISISIDWRYWGWELGPRYHAGTEEETLQWENNVISDILTLKKLPLKTATLVISDCGTEELLGQFNAQSQLQYRWTLEEKQKWARYVRQVFLEPKG